MMQVKSSRFILYMAYAFVLTVTLLYIRFPSAEFTAYCEQRFEKALNLSSCNIENVGYNFPYYVTLKNISLQKTVSDTQTRFLIDQISVRPGMRFWNTFKISGSTYSGSINSKLKIDWNESSYTLTDTVAVGLNISEILRDQGITNRKINGKLDGSTTLNGGWKSNSTVEGKARIAVTKGNIELLQPVLALTEIDFDKIVFDLSLTEEIELQEGKLKGKEINASFEGNITVMNSFQESRLRLSGLLEPKREFLQTHPLEAKMVKQYAKRFKKNGLPFKMGGTIATPTFRFSR